MSLTNFYVQSGASNLNAGSTTGNSAVFTSLTGDWDGTSVFTPTDGSTPASSVNVGDWCSIYPNGASIVSYIAQVTAVAAGVNGAVTFSTTFKHGAVPSSGSGTRNLKAGGAWASPSAFMDVGIGIFSSIASQPMKINVQKGTYTRTATDTCSMRGSGTNLVWIDGYDTTPGDLDSDSTDALTKPVFSYNSTFNIGFYQDGLIISNVSFVGSVSNYVLLNNNALIHFHRIRVENTSSNASAFAMSFGGGPSAVTDSWFKAPSSGTSNAVVKCSGGGFVRGCVFVGGGRAGIEYTGSDYITILNSVFISNTGYGIYISGSNPPIVSISGNTIISPTSDGILLPSSSHYFIVTGNVITGCGGYGINRGGANSLALLVANSFYNNTSGNVNNIGDCPNFYPQVESVSPVVSTTDPTLVSGALAVNNGLPGVFENTGISALINIGATGNPTSGGNYARSTPFFG